MTSREKLTKSDEDIFLLQNEILSHLALETTFAVELNSEADKEGTVNRFRRIANILALSEDSPSTNFNSLQIKSSCRSRLEQKERELSDIKSYLHEVNKPSAYAEGRKKEISDEIEFLKKVMEGGNNDT